MRFAPARAEAFKRAKEPDCLQASPATTRGILFLSRRWARGPIRPRALSSQIFPHPYRRHTHRAPGTVFISPRASDVDLAMRGVLQRAFDLTGLPIFMKMVGADQAILPKQIEESFVLLRQVKADVIYQLYSGLEHGVFRQETKILREVGGSLVERQPLSNPD